MESLVLDNYSPPTPNSLKQPCSPPKHQNTQAVSSTAPHHTSPNTQPTSIYPSTQIADSPKGSKLTYQPPKRSSSQTSDTPPTLLNQPSSLPSNSTSTIHPLRQAHHLPRTIHNPCSYSHRLVRRTARGFEIEGNEARTAILLYGSGNVAFLYRNICVDGRRCRIEGRRRRILIVFEVWVCGEEFGF